jgi:hypothetical protein
MKRSVELVLGAILLGLLYDKPYALTKFANSLLGKAILIVLVGWTAKTRGLAAGLLAALIVITLMHENIELMTNKSDEGVKVTPDKNAQAAIDAQLPQKKCTNDAECGVATTKCEDGQCTVNVQPEPELNAANKANVESFDIRVSEGFRNREAYQNTIEAMKFSNGQTGAGQNVLNQF